MADKFKNTSFTEIHQSILVALAHKEIYPTSGQSGKNSTITVLVLLRSIRTVDEKVLQLISGLYYLKVSI